jgi:hypothetical protein
MPKRKAKKSSKKKPLLRKTATAKSKSSSSGTAKAKKNQIKFGGVRPLTMAQILGLVTFFAKVSNKAFAGACY